MTPGTPRQSGCVDVHESAVDAGAAPAPATTEMTVKLWADEISRHYGVHASAQPMIMHRAWYIAGLLPKVRHVPRWRVLVHVTDRAIEDAIAAGIVRGTVFAAWGEYAARYSRYCHEYPRKQARRVRMARKRRRGWA